MTFTLFVQSLGWTLLHSLWQIALVGLGAALALRCTSHPRHQHRIAWLGLLLCLLFPLATFLRVSSLPQVVTHASQVTPLAVAPSVASGRLALAALPWPLRLQTFFTLHAAWVALAWGLGATFMTLRLGGAWLTTLRWRAETWDVPAAWRLRFQALVTQMNAGSKVTLRMSSRTAGPIALGVWRPLVLVPMSLLTDLPEPYVEALLAHELAHVRRRDYLSNLFQNVIEVLLFHHPVVWWLSRRIRTTRELLCDDLAAKAIGEPRRLALALDALDDLRSVPASHPHLALAARGGTLLHRIQRLVLPTQPSGRPAWLPAALFTLLLPCTALALRAAGDPPIPGNHQLIQQLDALAAKEGLDPNLLRAMAWVESGLRPEAKSPSGAIGVLQVMPETAMKYGAADMKDNAQVMAAGARYLRSLLDRYQGDVTKAVAAYNGGEQAVDQGRLSAETRAYVPLVMSVYQAKAVQPEAPLGEAAVEGVVRMLPDGKLAVDFRSSLRSNLQLDVFEDTPAAKSIGTVMSGSLDPITRKPVIAPLWTANRARLVTQETHAAGIVLRCADSGVGYVGEIRIPLDAPWKSFAFVMKPKG